ncbi:hypothetical protein AB0O14_05950 [Microbacterium foliorum]
MWVPRGVDPASRDVLVDGVPDYMKPALLEWVKPRVTVETYSGPSLNVAVFREYDIVARPTPPYSGRASNQLWPGFILRLPDEELLDLVDWLVHLANVNLRSQIESLLAASSSAWTIGLRNGNWGLVRRVPEAVQVAATDAMARGNAGALLSEAWAACFGRGPNPEEAYEKAIKAVEEAGASVVSPHNSRATLGTMLRDMRAQADWRLDLPGSGTDAPVSMIEALWTGQESRHGGNGYRLPTQSEAEAAVLLAVPLVQWFSSGAVARRS